MQCTATAAQLRMAQLRGTANRHQELSQPLTAEEGHWLTAALEMNLRLAHTAAYHRNESVIQMQFTEEGLRNILKYARQSRGAPVQPEHALNSATRTFLTELYSAGFKVYQEYEKDEIPAALWSYRGPQRLMLSWA